MWVAPQFNAENSLNTGTWSNFTNEQAMAQDYETIMKQTETMEPKIMKNLHKYSARAIHRKWVHENSVLFNILQVYSLKKKIHFNYQSKNTTIMS